MSGYDDLPALIAEHVLGTRALDFGCGAGRSTRFLRGLGFQTVGVDIAAPMLEQLVPRFPGTAGGETVARQSPRAGRV